MDASDIYAVDQAMIRADGTKDKSKLGANAILAVRLQRQEQRHSPWSFHYIVSLAVFPETDFLFR